MTIVALDARGLARLAAALREREAVVIPFASPLPYAVAATDAATVNRAKGRPSDQPCGILLGSAAALARHLDLDAATRALTVWIAEVEHANLLVPLRPGAPPWLSASAVDGFVGITLACLAQARPLVQEFGHLFVSSGNITSGRVGVTAGEVEEIFDGRRLVLDGDRFRDASRPQGSATIIHVRRSGRLRVARDGINNRSLAADEAAYLQSLRDRFVASRPTTDRHPTSRSR